MVTVIGMNSGDQIFVVKDGQAWQRQFNLQNPPNITACGCCMTDAIRTKLIELLGPDYKKNDGTNWPTEEEWQEAKNQLNIRADGIQEETVPFDADAFISDYMENKLGMCGVQDLLCLSCYIHSPNWLIDLQESLENAKFDLARFCTNSGDQFVLKNGRLRLRDYQTCVNLGHIRQFLRK